MWILEIRKHYLLDLNILLSICLSCLEKGKNAIQFSNLITMKRAVLLSFLAIDWNEIKQKNFGLLFEFVCYLLNEKFDKSLAFMILNMFCWILNLNFARKKERKKEMNAKSRLKNLRNENYVNNFSKNCRRNLGGNNMIFQGFTA